MAEALHEVSSPATLWQSALAHHLAGRLDQAQPLYRQLLALNPAHPDALHMLGVLLFQTNQPAPGLELLDAALRIDPHNPATHSHRGLVLGALHRPDDAIDAYLAALRLNPHMAEVHNNLANLLLARGNLDAAIHAYRQALAAQPGLPEAAINLALALTRTHQHAAAVDTLEQAAALHPDNPAIAQHLASAHNNLGALHESRGQRHDAIASFRKAVALNPNLPEAHFNLGRALAANGQYQDAIPHYHHALALKPHFPEALNNLGIALSARGQLPDAINAYLDALQLQPDSTPTLNNLAGALRSVGRLDESLNLYRAALALAPNDPELWNNLGAALDLRNQHPEALDAFQKALDLRPDFVHALNNRGNTLKNLGQLDPALDAYARALTLDPANQEIHSNRLYTLYFHPAASLDQIHHAHHQWAAAHAAPLLPAAPPALPPIAGRRLRIGYVGSSFRDHCQSFFTLPLLAHHDRSHFEIVIYSDTASPDAITARHQNSCDLWRNTAGLSDDAFADLVRHDRIDILVDLSLHMSHNRLLLFARKPAPIQVTWLGYPGTTGLSAIDYRLTDPFLDPPSAENDRFYAECSHRLPDTFWCYDPLATDPPVNALPALRNGHITFGCLNNFCKINDAVLALWAATLRQVPDSRLFLLAPTAAHPRLREFFHHHTIAPHRIEFADRTSRSRYLSLYHHIDVGLDTFPYNGHTTSLDSFWMGVPVVTLIGNAPVGRAGWSQLNNLALPHLAAPSPDQFVHIAATLAQRPAELAALRASLRQRLAASPLTDAPRFARALEHAFHTFAHNLSTR